MVRLANLIGMEDTGFHVVERGREFMAAFPVWVRRDGHLTL